MREFENHPLVGEVRGEGLLVGVELVKNKEKKELIILVKYNGKKNKTLPDKLHGANKENTYYIIDVLISIYNQTSKNNKNIVLSFIAGIATHIFVDAHFHPFIYYYTGNYYDKNMKRRLIASCNHRKFESMLDLHFDERASTNDTYNVDNIVNDGLNYIEQVFELGIIFKEYSVTLSFATLTTSYQNFKMARKIYTNKLYIKILYRVAWLLPINMRMILQLSYSNIKEIDLNLFKSTIEYRHPSSDQSVITSISKIKHGAIIDCLKFFETLENALDLGCVNGIGPSLETGIKQSSVYDMKFFK